MATHAPGDGSGTPVLEDLTGGVLTLTLNRPERLNAFTPALGHELIAAFDRADADDAVRAVVVTGAGHAFCAGADLGSGAQTFVSATRPDDAADTAELGKRDLGGLVALRIFRCLKPVIAAVNGAAVGVGATMQLAMDIRMACPGARYGFVFARRGIVLEAASSWFLPRLVGPSRALEWCFSGRLIGAQEAHEAGLVRSLHPPEELLGAAQALAREITEHSAPVSVALTRQMIWRMLGASDPMAAHRIDSRAVRARAASADTREGIASFLEKRPAHFVDRVSTDMPDFFPWWDELPFD